MTKVQNLDLFAGWVRFARAARDEFPALISFAQAGYVPTNFEILRSAQRFPIA